jgi:hypothetical protein
MGLPGTTTVTPGNHAVVQGGHALVGATAMSFAGWVRVNAWTGLYNRIFDFGKPGSPCVRLHRNGNDKLRFALSEWDQTSDSDFWTGADFSVGQYVHIGVRPSLPAHPPSAHPSS